MNLEVLVEERSAEQALRVLLKGYARWIGSADTCLVVLVDRDDDDCLWLKAQSEQMAAAAGLSTTSSASVARRVDVANRIAVEELEAWFFGDVPALCAAYPRVPLSLGQQAKYRDPDALTGGTWEALERLLQKNGYHRGGLAKIAAATAIALNMSVEVNSSRSFQVFRDGVRRLVAGGSSAAQD